MLFIEIRHYFGSNRREIQSTEWLAEINNIAYELHNISSELQDGNSEVSFERRAIVPLVNQLNGANPAMLLAAFQSDQLELMYEKFGDQPLSDKEAVTLISGLATFPEKLSHDKDINELDKEMLEDLNKGIGAKRGKCFNQEIDRILEERLKLTKAELNTKKKQWKEQQKMNEKLKIRLVTSSGQ